MPKFLNKLVERMSEWALQTSEVGRFDGIILVDVAWRRSDSFRPTIERSLQLVHAHDTRRYRRITRYIRRIANAVTNSLGTSYDFATTTLSIDFPFHARYAPDQDTLDAGCACVLVFAATQGLIDSRGLPYDGQNRVRIARLCNSEMNRFAANLVATDPGRYRTDLLQVDFDPDLYRSEWTASLFKKRLSFLSRWVTGMKAEPGASPNGGPGTPFRNSGGSDGRHR